MEALTLTERHHRGGRRSGRASRRAGRQPRSGADDRQVDRRRPVPAAGSRRDPASIAAGDPAGVGGRPGTAARGRPRPAAPRSASATAWRTTSPSEWPAGAAHRRPTPPSISGPPGPNGWLSRPSPSRPRQSDAGSAAQSSLGTREVGGHGHLEIPGSPGTAWTGMVQASSRAASSVQVRLRLRRVARVGRSRRSSRTPWASAPCAAAPIDRLDDLVVVDPLDRLGDGRTGMAAPGPVAVGDAHEIDTTTRPGAVVDEDEPVAGAGAGSWASRPTPAATDSWRRAPPGPRPDTPAQPRRRPQAPSVGRGDHDDPSDLRRHASAASVQARTGRPATGQDLVEALHPPAEPAATTTASTGRPRARGQSIRGWAKIIRPATVCSTRVTPRRAPGP